MKNIIRPSYIGDLGNQEMMTSVSLRKICEWWFVDAVKAWEIGSDSTDVFYD